MSIFCFCRQRRRPTTTVTALAGDISFAEKTGGSDENLLSNDDFLNQNPIYKSDSINSTPENCDGFKELADDADGFKSFMVAPEPQQPISPDEDDDSKHSDTAARPSSLDAETIIAATSTTNSTVPVTPSTTTTPSFSRSPSTESKGPLSPRDQRIVSMREAREKRKTVEEDMLLETLTLLDTFLDE